MRIFGTILVWLLTIPILPFVFIVAAIGMACEPNDHRCVSRAKRYGR